MKTKNKKSYMAPEMTAMTVRVERGFAGSGDLGLDENRATQNELENRNNAGNWGGEGAQWS